MFTWMFKSFSTFVHWQHAHSSYLFVVQRSLQASTLHFPGCRGAGQGQSSAYFAGLMKHVYLSMCAPCGRGGGPKMNVYISVSECIMLFLVQDGTPATQSLIHHPVAEWQSDIYGCLMLYIVRVTEKERELGWAEILQREREVARFPFSSKGRPCWDLFKAKRGNVVVSVYNRFSINSSIALSKKN